MLNKAFSQLSDEERIKKFDTVIREQTENLLDAERIIALAQGLNVNRQYIVAVYPTKRECCDALIKKNVLRIYIPEQQLQKERE
jgi:hypothetical protein